MVGINTRYNELAKLMVNISRINRDNIRTLHILSRVQLLFFGLTCTALADSAEQTISRAQTLVCNAIFRR